MTPSYSEDPLLGTVIAGRYRVERVVGEGGAGRVYQARQEAIGRDVAVKMLRYDVNAESRREFSSRFQREAALLGRLSHPNVVTVHDYGSTEQGDQFVVMELLRGGSLKELIRDVPVDPVRAAHLAEGIARGLKHAHEAGLVHRDIKPSNIHVVMDGDRERAVILDFGLVKASERDDDITRTGTYMGTPAYTAPEQARGEATVDQRADIYALGVLLYRMLAGSVPYQGQNPMGTVILHITEPYPPLVRTNPSVHVDPELEAIVQKAMEKAPIDRFQDAGALADALAAWIAKPHAPPVTAHHWAVPLVSGLGAGVLLTALAVVAIVSLGGAALYATWPRPDGVLVPATPPTPVQVVATPPVVPAAIEDDPPSPPKKSIATAPTAKPKVDPKPVDPKPAAEPKTADPKPAAESKPAAEPKPAVDPKPKWEPRPPAPVSDDPLVADNVKFDSQAHADKAIAWLNTASEQDLTAAHIYDKGVIVILANRPFTTVQKFAATSGIGEATVRAVANATK